MAFWTWAIIWRDKRQKIYHILKYYTWKHRDIFPPGKQWYRPQQAGLDHITSFQSEEHARRSLWSICESPERKNSFEFSYVIKSEELIFNIICSRQVLNTQFLHVTCATWSWMPPSAIIRRVWRVIRSASAPSELARFTAQNDMRNIRFTAEKKSTRPFYAINVNAYLSGN